ncbi:MAG: HlyD family efflux transporter periplasmic adaptor subunit [Bacteroidota bacterium]
MNLNKHQHYLFTFLLIGIILQSGLTSCSESANTAPEENQQVDSQVAENTPDGFVLTKEELALLPVKNGKAATYLPITGRVIPKNTTQLYAEVQGKVKESGFLFKEGSSFSRGQALLSLDSDEFSLQVEAQRSAFLNILTGVMPDLKADYPDNFESWKAYIAAYKSGESLQSLPETLSEGERFFLTANQVYSTYFNIKAQEERLSKYVVRAPYSGMVTESRIDKGSLVSPGQQVGTIINNRQYELEAAVSVSLASQLAIGDKIRFTSNNMEGEWIGRVSRMTDIVDVQTQNIPVYFTLTGKNLKGGIYLEGQFQGSSFEEVVTIPSSALTRDGKVFILEDNTILGKKVETVEILSDSLIVSGLSNDDMVITNTFEVPVEGKKISG